MSVHEKPTGAEQCFLVSEDCHRLGLRAGAVVFRGVRVGPANAVLRDAIRREAAQVQIRYSTSAAVRVDPLVAAFHELHRRVGANPRRDSPSVDRLLQLARKRGDLPAINNLVDAYNLVSLRSRCSLGAHDLDAITLPVTLRLLAGTELFTPLGTTEPATATAGEFGYVDAADRLLCRLDVVQADFSKVTEQTTNVLLIVESTAAHPAADHCAALEAAQSLIREHCGGHATIAG